MDDDLDRLLDRLRRQPAPDELRRLEADLLRRIEAARPVTTPAWRTAAVGLALAAGLGVGGAAAAVTDGDRRFGPELAGGARLAPSALLGGAQ